MSPAATWTNVLPVSSAGRVRCNRLPITARLGLPVACKKTVCASPDAICNTLFRMTPAVVTRAAGAPQLNTLPSALRATLWWLPALIATMLVTVGGMVNSPTVFVPQPMTFPAVDRASA